MALPNPSFEPKTHQWRPGAVAPSREVPSQICAILGQKQQFSPKIAPKPGRNAQTKENSGHTPRAAWLHRVKEPSSALRLHDMSEKRPKKAPKSPKNLRHVHQHPETKHGPYLGIHGSNPNLEGT